jgi:chaperonin GroES
MNLKPLKQCVLVERDIQKQEGLIVLPKEKLFTGVVKAIGPKVEELMVDDHILFGEYSGQPVKHDGKEYLMMNESDVIGVLHG